MVRSIVAAAAFGALAASSWAEVDFTPRESYYLAEATKVPNVAFRNGAKDLTYTPPTGWSLSGGGRKVSLIPQDKVQASAVMQTQPVRELLPATDENVKVYADAAVNLIPREASKVNIVSAAVAPLRISNHAMVEVTITYACYGQQFTTDILILPYVKEQLVFQLTARTADYAPLAKTFQRSLFSMQGL
jgi:hypothetical protein